MSILDPMTCLTGRRQEEAGGGNRRQEEARGGKRRREEMRGGKRKMSTRPISKKIPDGHTLIAQF